VIPPTSIEPFALERYFARYEFQAPYLLSSSDCETLSTTALLAMAGRSVAPLGALTLGYTESSGSPDLRAAITNLYQHSLTIDDILVVVPEEGIFLTMWALLSPGDQVIVQTPCYQSLTELAVYQQAEVITWPIRETETGWQVDLDHLADLITARTKLLVLNTPHNPTGYHFSRSQFDDIINLAHQYGLWLFCDEMYWGSEYRSQDRLPSASQLYERAISLSGLSKTYGLPGLRVGWLISRDQAMISRLLHLKDYTTICPSAPSEFLAEVALGVAGQLARRSLEIIQSNLTLAQEFAQRQSDLIGWRPPKAGSVAFARFRPGGVKALVTALVEAEGVMIAPAHTFHFGDYHFRLGLGRLNFSTGLRRFERFLQHDI